MRRFSICILILTAIASSGLAGVLTFGDQDCLGQGCYGVSDPTSGATTQGLATGTITLSSTGFGHTFPFSPSADFAGTDQIFVGSTQTGAHDGYSAATERISGPAIFILDYSSLIALGQTVTSITLGVAADDFQFPEVGNSFTASVNGTANAALATQLNTFDQNGPIVQFFTIGLDPSIDLASHILTLSIDEGGDGGDGFAVDFLTVGITTATTAATPEPSTFALVAGGILGAALLRRRK